MKIPTEAIRKELAPGERVLWSGSPVPGLRFESGDLSKSGFGLIFFSTERFRILVVLAAAVIAGLLWFYQTKTKAAANAFDEATRLYWKGDYTRAIPLFEEFVKKNAVPIK